jgi:hypothetical protein
MQHFDSNFCSFIRSYQENDWSYRPIFLPNSVFDRFYRAYSQLYRLFIGGRAAAGQTGTEHGLTGSSQQFRPVIPGHRPVQPALPRPDSSSGRYNRPPPRFDWAYTPLAIYLSTPPPDLLDLLAAPSTAAASLPAAAPLPTAPLSLGRRPLRPPSTAAPLHFHAPSQPPPPLPTAAASYQPPPPTNHRPLPTTAASSQPPPPLPAAPLSPILSTDRRPPSTSLDRRLPFFLCSFPHPCPGTPGWTSAAPGLPRPLPLLWGGRGAPL